MFRPGPEWIVVLLVVALFIFGAKRLPEIGSSLGKGLRLFKSSISGEDEEQPKQKEDIEKVTAGSPKNDDPVQLDESSPSSRV